MSEEDPEVPPEYYDRVMPMEVDSNMHHTQEMMISPIPFNMQNLPAYNSSNGHVSDISPPANGTMTVNGDICSNHDTTSSANATTMVLSATSSSIVNSPSFIVELLAGRTLPISLIWDYLHDMENATWDSLVSFLLLNGPPRQAQRNITTLLHSPHLEAVDQLHLWACRFLRPNTGFGLIVNR